jgi:hypothetical protein
LEQDKANTSNEMLNSLFNENNHILKEDEGARIEPIVINSFNGFPVNALANAENPKLSVSSSASGLAIQELEN